MNIKHKRDVIIACDFPDGEKTLDFLALFGSERPFVKIGMELFYAEGPDIVKKIKSRGHKVFLDLKLHDIPNTVFSAMRSLRTLDIDMCNVHAAGGQAMMKTAIEGLTRPDGSRPLLIAVTQLTSTSPEMLRHELLISHPIEKVVMSYAQNARAAGLDGVVCSPLEAERVHAVCGDDFITVTPGIRFSGGDMSDQVRVTTPAIARELGSDYIVVGRPITSSPDPIGAYRRCLADFIG
jgi:orotidine-5'-phosphate decarboxylase